MVPDVRVDVNSININNNIVTLRLKWGEPFDNYDPIMSYAISCSSDVKCPPSFRTSNITRRTYTIFNLIPMNTYTFSVVATNSFGDGEAGLVNYTTLPGNHM